MKDLLIHQKSRFGRAEFTEIGTTLIDVNFKKSEESVLIEKEKDPDRYSISYLRLIVQAKGKKKKTLPLRTIFYWKVLVGFLNKLRKMAAFCPRFNSNIFSHPCLHLQ